MNRCRNNQRFIGFSLRQINYYSLICLLSIVFLSDSVGARTKVAELQIVKQPVTKKENLENRDVDPKLKLLLEEANKLQKEGQNLQQQGTLESRKQAIAKYEQALKIHQRQDVKAAFDQVRETEAVLLLGIGGIYSVLGDNKKAVEYLENSLVISRELKDNQLQCETLIVISQAYTALGEKQKAFNSLNETLRLGRIENNPSLIMDTLFYIAATHSQYGEDQEVIKYHNEALEIAKNVNDLPKQADILSMIADTYRILEESDKALNFYKQALAINEKTNNLLEKSGNLVGVASVYAMKGESQQVDKYVQQVLKLESEIEKKIQQHPEIIVPDCNLDQVPEQQRQRKKAECTVIAQKKLIFLKHLNRIKISANYFRLFDPKQGLVYLNQQLTLAHQLGRPLEEANSLNVLGSVYADLGDTEKALDLYQKALAQFQTLNNPSSVAFTLESIGSLYQTKGEYQQAIDAFKQAVNIFSKINRPLEVSVLSSLAHLYRDLGDYEQSLSTFQEAIKISKQIKFDVSIDSIKLGIAKTYLIRGEFTEKVNGSIDEARIDYKVALEYSLQSLKYNHEKGNANAEIINLANIARTHELLKNYPQAIDSAQQALALSRKKKLKFGERLSLNNLSSAYQVAGKYPEALETTNQLISLSRQAEDISKQAAAYEIQGKVYSGMKQPRQAIEAFKQGLALRQKIQDTTNQAVVLYEMAKVERDRGNLTVALEDIKQATDIVESSRTKVNNPDLRTSYFASKQDYYKFYIDLLMQLHKQNPNKGYDALALNVSERSRGRSLVELLTQAGANIRKGINPKLLAEEQRLQQSLNAKVKARSDILDTGKTNEAAKATVEQLTKEIADIISQQQQLKTTILTESPQYGSLKYPQPLELKGIQQQLDKDTILLQYSLGKERSYLWLVTSDSLQAYELPKGEDIEKAVENFRDVILAGNSPYGKDHPDEINQPALQLSQMILAPVANKLGKKRLVIVADGALHNIPFAALADPDPTRSLSLVSSGGGASRIAFPGSSLGTRKGKQDKDSLSRQAETSYQPLVINHEIVNLPSITAIATQREQLNNRKLSPKTLAVLADPFFTTEQVTGKPQALAPEFKLDTSTQQRAMKNLKRSGLDPLPGTRIEAEAMLKLVPSGQSTHAFGADANYEFVSNPALKQYQHLFFATHGFVDTKQPELSGIVLSQFDKNGKPVEKGYLRLGDIFNMDWAAELVVLSACETGLGRDTQGEGLVGLTRGLMYAGSKRAVVSLWKVSDKGTSELMPLFYKSVLAGKSPAVALRQAQLQMLESQEWRNPYFWSAFTLQGEWR